MRGYRLTSKSALLVASAHFWALFKSTAGLGGSEQRKANVMGGATCMEVFVTLTVSEHGTH